MYEHNNAKSLMLELNNIYFPSTTNSRTIGQKWVISNGRRFKKPFLMKNEGQQAALNEITALYIQQCAKHSVKPQFDGLTTIIVLLGHRSGKWDSHNYSKSIGDWLQSVGIIEDDSLAEILCFKRSDYSEEGGDLILIQSREQVYAETENYIRKLFAAATGKFG